MAMSLRIPILLTPDQAEQHRYLTDTVGLLSRNAVKSSASVSASEAVCEFQQLAHLRRSASCRRLPTSAWKEVEGEIEAGNKLVLENLLGAA